MSFHYLNQETHNGHIIGEIYSAMQKSMRRCDKKLAFYCANELKQLNNNGLAIRLIQNNLEDSFDYKIIFRIYNDRANRDRLFKYVNIICEQPKTHLPAFINKLYKELDYKKNEIDDIIMNFTTEEKRISKFIGTKGAPQVAICKLYQEQFKKYYQNIDFDDDIYKDYPEIQVERLDLPQYVYDKHCPRSSSGNKRGQRGYQYFFDNLILFNEIKLSDEQNRLIEKAKGLYLTDQMFKLDGQEDFIQAQLRTSEIKPATRFIKINGKWDIVLKGPLDAKFLEAQVKSEEIKKAFGLNYSLIKQQYRFLLFKNVIPIDEDDFSIQSSKLEENVKIYTGDKYRSTFNDLDNIEYLKCLMFRKMIGTNDTVVNNILNVDGQFYTIDDPALNQDKPFIYKIKHTFNISQENMNKLEVIKQQWIKQLQDNDSYGLTGAINRLNNLQWI